MRSKQTLKGACRELRADGRAEELNRGDSDGGNGSSRGPEASSTHSQDLQRSCYHYHRAMLPRAREPCKLYIASYRRNEKLRDSVERL